MKSHPLSWRPLLLSIPLTLASAYWMAFRVTDGIMALSVPPFVFLFLLSLFNLFLSHFHWLKRFTLSPIDLGTIWTVLAVATAIACGWRDAPTIAGFLTWFDSPANNYRELVLPYVPSWLVTDYRDALQAFFGGHRPYDLYRLDHLKAWAIPALGWTALLSVTSFLMLCLLLLLAPRWLEQERLSYPIATIPLRLIRDPKEFFRLKSFWAGFVLAGSYDFFQGLIYWWRGERGKSEFDISSFLPFRPWSAIGWTPLSFQPFILSLTYFIPTELSISSVLFFWFRKFQQVASDALGYEVQPLWGGMIGKPSPPYLTEQSVGALFSLSVVYLWQTRHYLAYSLRPRCQKSDWHPLVRFGLWGIIFGLISLTALLTAMRSNTSFLLLYLIVFLALSTTISKIRAQIGPPIHEFVGMGAHRFFFSLLGSERLGDRLITVIGFLYFTYRIWRGNPMCQMVDGFKIAYEIGGLDLRFISALSFGIILGTLAMFWSQLQAGYIQGSGEWWHIRWVMEWRQEKKPFYPAVLFTSAGCALTLLLLSIHHLFPSLFLHPAAYALTMNFGVDFYWFPMLIMGLFKSALIRYGGQKAYRNLAPFALGIITGEYVMGSVWSWIWILTRRPTYVFSVS